MRGSVEVGLETCIAMPYVHVHKGNRDQANRAYSFAFICHKGTAAQWSHQGGENLIAKEANGSLWITLAETNIFAILQELAQGRGKMVVRAFWYWERLERHPEEARKAMLMRDAQRRDCEAMTAAGSPVTGPGSPNMVPGSPGSAGSAGSGDGHAGDVDLGEPAVCELCEVVRD